MLITKKLTAIYTAFTIAFTPFTPIYKQRAIVNSETNTFEASVLIKPSISTESNIDELMDVTEEYTDDIELNEGYVTTTVNIRKNPDVQSDILGSYYFNEKIMYSDYDDLWIEVDYDNNTAYISKDYISDEEVSYKEYEVPNTSGFKSYMSYKTITSTNSKQYKLQQQAYTGDYGIREVDGRYCVAIGSYFTSEIGTLFDLVLENGTVIPCILADQKADRHTDSKNIVTTHNGCMSEFVVDMSSLQSSAKLHGDMSYVNDEWDSPVEYLRVYE